jgi:hypothetical protein
MIPGMVIVALYLDDFSILDVHFYPTTSMTSWPGRPRAHFMYLNAFVFACHHLLLSATLFIKAFIVNLKGILLMLIFW